MDLIEIVKGMSNAGEAINENFKKLNSEVGENANGHYIKFKNGLTLCFKEVSINRDISSDGGNTLKPVALKRNVPHASGISAASTSTSGLDRIDAWRMTQISYNDSWSFGRNYRDFSNWAGTGKLNIVLWAVGFIENE